MQELQIALDATRGIKDGHKRRLDTTERWLSHLKLNLNNIMQDNPTGSAADVATLVLAVLDQLQLDLTKTEDR